MPTISEMIATVNAYYAYRGLTDPTLAEAAKFLATEVGELVNASTRLEEKWVRNNPVDAGEARVQFEYELGDVYMMTLKVVEKSGFDPDVFEYRERADTDFNSPFEHSLSTVFWNAAYLYEGSQAGRFSENSIWAMLHSLYVVGSQIGVHPYQAMLNKFKSKGFTLENS